MPYSELDGMRKGKLESTQTRMNSCSGDLAFMPDNEFMELVWENGQISMQGQSSRSRKSPSCTGFLPHTSKVQEKDGDSTVTRKTGRLGTMDSVLSDFSSLAPSGRTGLSQDDDMVPWLNYPLEDSLQHAYCSEFFRELSGVNFNENDAVPIGKNSNYGHIVKNSYKVSVHSGVNPGEGSSSKVVGGVLEPTRNGNSQLYASSLQQCQTSVPSIRSRVSDFYSSNTNNAHQAGCLSSSQTLNLTRGSPDIKMQKQDPLPKGPSPPPSRRTGLINFSHFARPAALIKSNLQGIGAATTPSLSSIDRLRSDDKVSIAGSSNPVEPTLIESTSSSRRVTGFQSHRALEPNMVDVKSSVAKPLSTEQSEAICQEDFSMNNRLPDQIHVCSSSFVASTSIGRPDNEKAIEQVIASSSVCSGNGTGGASSNPKHRLKRKYGDTDESEYQSEDAEEESVDARKPAPARGGTGSKRSRAAEVHNLSERRRRDRINEKMRALQELIPNCDKVDKASMLDEAIEYLKNLQLQVQIMSMATGLCMPPMMLQTGMQHIHAPHLSHFSPMGVGMGMGLGIGVNLGMGMFDISGGSSPCNLVRVPPMHGVQFPSSPIARPTSFPPMFGLPGQGFPTSMPYSSFFPSPGGPSTKPVTVADISGATTPLDHQDSASVPLSSTKDATQTTMVPKTIADCLQNLTSPQSQATKEGCKQPEDRSK